MHSLVFVCHANTASALKHEKLLADLGDEVVTDRSTTKTVLVVRHRTALAEDEWTFICVVAVECTALTLLGMSLSERIILWYAMKDLLRSNGLGPAFFFRVSGDLILLPLPHAATWLGSRTFGSPGPAGFRFR